VLVWRSFSLPTSFVKIASEELRCFFYGWPVLSDPIHSCWRQSLYPLALIQCFENWHKAKELLCPVLPEFRKSISLLEGSKASPFALLVRWCRDAGENDALVEWQWQGKPKYWKRDRPSSALSTTNTTWNWDRTRTFCGERPATNRLSLGTALTQVQLR